MANITGEDISKMLDLIATLRDEKKELLGELKYLRNYARLIDVSDETVKRVDAIIAKAEGSKS